MALSSYEVRLLSMLQSCVMLKHFISLLTSTCIFLEVQLSHIAGFFFKFLSPNICYYFTLGNNRDSPTVRSPQTCYTVMDRKQTKSTVIVEGTP